MRKFKNEQGETMELRVKYRVTDKTPFWDGVPGVDIVFDIDDKEAEAYTGFFPERYWQWYPDRSDEARNFNPGDLVELSFHNGNPHGEDHPTGVWQ